MGSHIERYVLETVYRIGSYLSDLVTGIKSLYASVDAAGNYDTFEERGSDYVVPTGKKFYITRISYTGKYNAGGIEIGYGDTGVGNSASAPTNFVSLTGANAATKSVFATEAHLPKQFDCWFEVPAGKYPCLHANTTADGACVVEGVEK